MQGARRHRVEKGGGGGREGGSADSMVRLQGQKIALEKHAVHGKARLKLW